jgi:hypothetical protein
MTDKYILDERGEPVREDDLDAWALWYEKANRKVAETAVGPFSVSTVFLGLNHAWADTPPILWETIVFDPHGEECDSDRCSGTREQAEAMHWLMVRKWERKYGK